MTPGLRKFALTAHITFSVGWLGAVVAYLAVAIACLVSQDAQTVRSGYSTMELTGWFVIVPLGLAALLTGLAQSLGTERGFVPVLLDCGEIRVDCGGRHHLVAAHAGGEPQVRRKGRGGPRGGRSAGVARHHDVVRVQTVGQNSLRATYAAGAA